MTQAAIQSSRLLTQMGFFVLFAVTPVFDLLRYDLVEGHAWFLTYEWHVGIDDFIAGELSALAAAGSILLYLFLPLLGVATLVIGVLRHPSGTPSFTGTDSWPGNRRCTNHSR